MTALRQRMSEELELRGYSHVTVKRYTKAVAQFARHFNKSPEKLGPQHIREYQIALFKRGLSTSSLNIAVSSLKFLYRVVLEKDWVVERVPYTKTPKKLPVVLSQDEMRKLIKCIDNDRYRLAVMTAFDTGMRVSEVCKLRVRDIDSARKTIHIRLGKGRKDRMLPLSEGLLQKLRDHWRKYRPADYFFPTADGKPLAPNTLRRAIQSAARKAKIEKRVSTLRHIGLRTVATCVFYKSASVTRTSPPPPSTDASR